MRLGFRIPGNWIGQVQVAQALALVLHRREKIPVGQVSAFTPAGILLFGNNSKYIVVIIVSERGRELCHSR